MSATPIKKQRLQVPPAPPAPAREAQPLKIKTNLSLTVEANDCLTRIKAHHGINRDFAASRGIIMLEQALNSPGHTL